PRRAGRAPALRPAPGAGVRRMAGGARSAHRVPRAAGGRRRSSPHARAAWLGLGASREDRLMHAEPEPPAGGQTLAEDLRRLHAMGYAQELARRLGAFSNFALSLSIICILAGGVTSFHLGLCSVGGAAIGLGWPLAGLFAM